jgi:hypothetical protein
MMQLPSAAIITPRVGRRTPLPADDRLKLAFGGKVRRRVRRQIDLERGRPAGDLKVAPTPLVAVQIRL